MKPAGPLTQLLRRSVFGCVLVALLLLTPVLPIPAAHACSCAPPEIDRSLQQSDGAIVGTFLGRGQDDRDNFDFDGTEYLFEVEEWVKGEGTENLSIWSASNGAGCGLELNPGQTAGLFLTLRNGKAQSSLCETVGAGQLLGANIEEPALAGVDFTDAETSQPNVSVPEIDNGPGDQAESRVFWIASAFGVLALLLIAGFAVTRRPSSTMGPR